MSHLFLKMRLSMVNSESGANLLLAKGPSIAAETLSEMNPHKGGPILQNLHGAFLVDVLKHIPNVQLHSLLECCEFDKSVLLLNTMDGLKAKWVLEKWDHKKRALMFAHINLAKAFSIMQCWHMEEILSLVKVWHPKRLAELISEKIEEPMVQSIIEKLPAANTAAAFDAMENSEQMMNILAQLKFEKMMEILAKMIIKNKLLILKSMNETQMIEAFNQLPGATVAEILWEFQADVRPKIISKINAQLRNEVKEKLEILKTLKKTEEEDKKAHEKLEKEREQLAQSHENDYLEEFEARIDKLESAPDDQAAEEAPEKEEEEEEEEEEEAEEKEEEETEEEKKEEK